MRYRKFSDSVSHCHVKTSIRIQQSLTEGTLQDRDLYNIGMESNFFEIQTHRKQSKPDTRIYQGLRNYARG